MTGFVKNAEKRYRSTMRVNPFLVFLACLLWASILQAAGVSISASISQNEIGVGQALTYQVTVSGDQNTPAPKIPSLPDFNVGSSGTSQSVNIINGNVSISRTYTYTFVPNKEGDYTIPPAEIEYGGQVYKTESFTIKVVPAAQAPPPPQQQQQSARSPFDDFQDPFQQAQPRTINVLFRAVPSKTTAYVGEEIVLTYKLFTTGQLQLDGMEPVDTQDFWSEPVPAKGQIRPEGSQNLNGVGYSVYPIEKVLLFPLSSGTKNIKPIKIQVSTGGPFGFGQSRVFPSNPVTLTVLPLPSGKPSGFSGAVGEYSMSASVDKQSCKQNDAISLKITISGNGHVKSVGKPVQPDLGSFKLYSSTAKSSMDIQSGSAMGTKLFEYVLIPLQSGRLTIPPFEFSYFNPSSARYKILRTQPIQINVTPVSEKEMQNINYPADQSEIKLLNQDIFYIREKHAVHGTVPLHHSVVFIIFVLIETVAFIGFIFWRIWMKRMDSDSVLRKRSFAYRNFRKGASKLAELMESGKFRRESFISDLEKILIRYFADKFTIPGSELIMENIILELEKRTTDRPLIKRCKEVIESVEMMKYAPIKTKDVDEAKYMLEEARAVVVEMESVRRNS